MLTMTEAMKTAMLTTFAVLATAACDNPKTDTTTTTSAPTPAANPNNTNNANNPSANTQPSDLHQATTPAATPSPIANAKNASDVTLFPEQQKVAPTTMKIVTPAATIRTAPQGTSQVLVAKQGLEVTEVAKDRGYYLVLFNDPSDSTVQKAGWIYRDALESPAATPAGKDANGKPLAASNAKGAPASAAAAKLTCAAGQVRIQTNDAFCGNQCKSDSDCKNVDGMCDGYGNMVSQSGQLTPAHYCVTNSVRGSTMTSPGSNTNSGSNTNPGSNTTNPTRTP